MKYINTKFFKSLKGKVLNLVKSKKTLVVALASVVTLSGCVAEPVPDKVEVDTRPSYEYSEQVTRPNTQVEEPTTNIGPSTNIEQSSNIESSTNNDIVETTPEETVKPEPIIQTALDEDMLTILRTEVSLSDDALNQFISNIHNVKVNYQYSELFGTDLALQRYESLKEYESTPSTYIVNGKINKSLIRQTILDNNKEYMANYTAGRYTEFSSSEFDKVFNIFIESLEYSINNGTDLGQLDKKLGDLKILKMTSRGSGVMTDDETILALNLDVIDTYKTQNASIDYIRTVVLHETNHFGQIHSEHERDQEGYTTNMGMSYRWDDLKVNTLNHMWYYEGAAEQLMLDQYGEDIDPTVYANNIKAIDTLTLSALLRTDVDALTLSKLTLQTDLNELFKIFNCTTREEKIEVINMMYAYDIILYQNADFFNAYKEQNGKVLENRYDYFNSLNASIAQTLTKNFYINLSSYLVDNNATLEDIFGVISVFETEMSRLTKYGQSSYMEENADFIAMYNKMQTEFFGIVASYLGLEVEDVKTFYNAYYGDKISRETTTSMLTQDELEYVNDILNDRSTSRKNTVNEVGESFKIK